MKFKQFFLIIILSLFIQKVFANQDDGICDSILKRNMIYVVLTGDQTFDDLLNKTFRNEWQITPYKFITRDDKSIQGLVPVFFMATCTYYNAALIRVEKIPDIHYSASQNPYPWEIGYSVPNNEYLPTLFLIPDAVKSFNDAVDFYKKNHRDATQADINLNAAEIRNKTLIVPKEMIEKSNWGRGKVLNFITMNRSALDAYKYKYKIMPLAEIDRLLSDSADAQNYCILSFTTFPCPLYIFDGGTGKCLLEYDNTSEGYIISESRVSKNNMRSINRKITRLKKGSD